MKVFLLWLVFAFLLVVLGLAVLWLRTYWLEQSADGLRFRQGSVEGVRLDGLYSGAASVQGSWVGKRVIGGENRGINVFEKDGEQSEQYPFAVVRARGLRDYKDVIALDYNQAGNPWWLRLITDEIVEVVPGEYLGKVYLRILPNTPFTVGFFTLKGN